jgi:hypothetical protein
MFVLIAFSESFAVQGPKKIFEENVCHTWFLCQNRVLIICMTQDQMFHTYGQKGSQKTKCHNIKYNYYTNIVFIDQVDSQRNGTAEDSITRQEWTTGGDA